MQSIINGIKYDTETAQCVFQYISKKSFRFFVPRIQNLFEKKNGELFLEFIDEKSHYLLPFTETQAKEWAEKFLTVKQYEFIFGQVSE